MKSFTQGHMTAVACISLLAWLVGCATNSNPVGRTASSNSTSSVFCSNCGTITGIAEVKEKGNASGVGAVLGAVAGAVIGHQIGDGRGQDAATATGAIGGGIAGHQIEKRIQGTSYFQVTVAMENGSTHVANVDSPNGLSIGSRVKVVGNNLQVAG